jgi:hypothetical protein
MQWTAIAEGSVALPARSGTVRWSSALAGSAIGLLLAMLVLEALSGTVQATRTLSLAAGHDSNLYLAAAHRWLNGGGFYESYQLAGPYPVVEREILYPPILLPILVPFIWLPGILWWLIPLGIVAFVVVSWRPRPWAIVGILLCLTVPTIYDSSVTQIVIASGNPVMWVAAFVALSTRWSFFGPFALLKPAPVLMPFALSGLWRRAWWAGLAVLTVVSLAFLPMWGDYVEVILHARGVSWTYAFLNVPLLAIPIVAWTGRRGSGAMMANPVLR